MTDRFFVLVDDQREYKNMDVTARNYRAAIPALRDNPVTHLLIDNDLGNKKDGYDILVWARDNDRMPTHVFIVSANPVARGRMEALLEHDMKYVHAPEDRKSVV